MLERVLPFRGDNIKAYRLHFWKKADTPGCSCQDEEGEEGEEQSGEHLVESCRSKGVSRGGRNARMGDTPCARQKEEGGDGDRERDVERGGGELSGFL